jgi:hypothetical protein
MATTASTAPAKGFSKIVHAYRRLPHMVGDPPKEKAVEVVCCGHKAQFHSNDKGHVVAEVTSREAFDHLTRNIPEAYMEYTGETPEIKAPEQPAGPVGTFVLTNGSESYVLDDKADDELRAFAKQAGLEDEQLPAVLTGDTLRMAIYNLLGAG